MKKVFAFCVVLSFVLSACGDDSSSTAPVTVGAESSPAMGVSSSSGEPASEVAEDSGYAAVVVERVKVACNQIGGFAGMIEQPALDSLEISVAGDTLYVKPLVGDSAGTECACQAKFFFRVGAESPFMNTSLLVVNDQLNLGNRMQIYNKTAEKKKEQERAAFLERGFKAGRCVAGLDGVPVANKPALFKDSVTVLVNVELPEHL